MGEIGEGTSNAVREGKRDGHRDRIANLASDRSWTPEEIELLKLGVQRHGSDWRTILADPELKEALKSRSVFSLKSKWGRMCKKTSRVSESTKRVEVQVKKQAIKGLLYSIQATSVDVQTNLPRLENKGALNTVKESFSAEEKMSDDSRQPISPCEESNSNLSSISSHFAEVSEVSSSLHALLPQIDETLEAKKKSKAMFLTKKGIALFDLGKIQDSIFCFTDAIATFPDWTEAYMCRCLCFIVQRELDSAMLDSSIVVQLDKESALGYVTRAMTLLAKGEPTRSLEDCEAALRFQPRLLEGFCLRSIIRFYQGINTGSNASNTTILLRTAFSDMLLCCSDSQFSWNFRKMLHSMRSFILNHPDPIFQAIKAELPEASSWIKSPSTPTQKLRDSEVISLIASSDIRENGENQSFLHLLASKLSPRILFMFVLEKLSMGTVDMLAHPSISSFIEQSIGIPHCSLLPIEGSECGYVSLYGQTKIRADPDFIGFPMSSFTPLEMKELKLNCMGETSYNDFFECSNFLDLSDCNDSESILSVKSISIGAVEELYSR